MHTTSARDALSYAISQELARIYAVIIAGWILTTLGLDIRAFMRSPLELLVAYPLLLVGVIALYGGTIALLFKIIADANAVAAASVE